MPNIIIDLDDTLTIGETGDYESCDVNLEVLNTLKNYQALGFKIVIHTARNMRTYEGDLQKIEEFSLPVIIDWLSRHNVPYDEVIVGKPWCGTDGFYVDDRAIRPDEFVENSYEEILRKIRK